MKTADVIIIGAGVIGCAIARQLAKEKLQTLILDKQQPGLEASWAAAGMLCPQAETDTADEFFELCLASNELYPNFAEAVSDESGIDVEYRAEGTLVLAYSEEEEKKLAQRAAWQRARGLPIEELNAEAARKFAPAITSATRSGLFVPNDRQVNNRQLAKALALAAANAGAELRTGQEAQEILLKDGRAIGARVNGEILHCGTVVNAAGCWAGLIESEFRPAVKPVRGQMISLSSQRKLFDCVIHAPDCYLVPRYDGQVVVGSTTEQVGFDKSNTAAGLNRLLSAAIKAAPSLKDFNIAEMWAGLRPGTPDDKPLLGYAKENLIFATGHYRNGILLAPITAEIVSALIFGRSAPSWLSVFAPNRFAETMNLAEVG